MEWNAQMSINCTLTFGWADTIAGVTNGKIRWIINAFRLNCLCVPQLQCSCGRDWAVMELWGVTESFGRPLTAPKARLNKVLFNRWTHPSIRLLSHSCTAGKKKVFNYSVGELFISVRHITLWTVAILFLFLFNS